MAKYMLKLDSVYDEHLVEKEGGKQAGELNVWVTYGYGSPRINPIIFTKNNQGQYVYGSCVYDGPGFYIMGSATAVTSGRYERVGTETREYSQYGGETATTEFVVLESVVDHRKLWFLEDEYYCDLTYRSCIFTESNGANSRLVQVKDLYNSSISVCRNMKFMDVPGGNFVAKPVPGVSFVNDTQESMTAICYNYPSPPDVPEPPIRFNFPDSAATYQWSEYGVTDDWFDNIINMWLSEPPYNPEKYVWCIDSIGGRVPAEPYGDDPPGAVYLRFDGNDNLMDVTSPQYIWFNFTDSKYEKNCSAKFYKSNHTIVVETTWYDPG